MKVQEYEDEDEEDEPGLWTRVRSLLLSLGLQLYHRMMKVREQLQTAVRTLGDAADAVRLHFLYLQCSGKHELKHTSFTFTTSSSSSFIVEQGLCSETTGEREPRTISCCFNQSISYTSNNTLIDCAAV